MAETYEVRVRGQFSAVHRLRLEDGSLEPLHGHDWKVETVFRGATLNSVGFLIDFERAGEVLAAVVGELNYADLNTHAWLEGINPTAEHVARTLLLQLRERLGADCPLAAVYVEEAPGCIAGFMATSS
jgi:6-pyruvoyltetrahydropterin/6-carboxytetrahydropterin synthase